MLKNHFILAVRNLSKHKAFSLINILGLSIGITCCLLLALFVRDEWQFDRHFDGYERIYRITSTFIDEGGRDELPRTSPPVAMALIAEFPEIETATRVVSPPEVEHHLIRYGDNTVYERKGYLVDSTFFHVFPYAFELGDPATALHNPSTVVLSHPLARKIFGDESPLDQLLIINSGTFTDTFRITGVLKPFVKPGQVDAGFYMSMNSKGWGAYISNETTWTGQNFVFGFLRLRPHAKADDLVAKLPAVMEKYAAEEMKEMGRKKTLGLQPLKEMHLYSGQRFSKRFGGDIGPTGNINYLFVLVTISVFILFIACINFVNLTTAKATQRAGEVGIRKSLGADRMNLMKQFLGETFAIVILAALVSVGMVQVFLPVFNTFTQKNLSLSAGDMGYLFSALLTVIIFTAIAAGSYPAFFLSSFQPARALKEKYAQGAQGNALRKGLVVIQFVVSMVLVSAILVIQKQMQFMQDKTLGFSADHRVVIPLRSQEAKEAYLRLKDRFVQLSGVHGVSATSALPGSPTLRDLPLYPQGSDMDHAHAHLNINVDENYFPLLDIPLLAGRQLSLETDAFDFQQDVNNILINRAALATNNLTLDDAVGSDLNIDWQGLHKTFRVVGVVDDFHQLSMHREMSPTIFLLPSSRSGFVEMCAGVTDENLDTTVPAMEKIWKEIVPFTPFEHSLLRDNVRKQYDPERRVLAVMVTFTTIAIFISCLGLYGLSVFMAERKTKEIGIRKILGASVRNIVGLFSADIFKLIAIAFVVAVPVAYFVMDRWLENFAYKTTMSAWLFVMAGLGSFAIAWFTIGFESLKAAMGNPVNSLRRE